LILRNINVRGHAEVNVMKSLLVKDLCSKEFRSIAENRNFDDIVNNIISGGQPYVFVHHVRTGNLMGVISINDIRNVIFHKDALRNVCIAGDIAFRKIRRVELDDNCRVALKRMKQSGYDCLPVVDSHDENKQIGVIWLQDIVAAYDEEIEHIDITSGLADKIAMSNLESDIRFLEGYVITELPVPHSFVGRSIKELQIRTRYGVDILSIKGASKHGHVIEAIPRADYTFGPTDVLVVAGKADSISQLKIIE